VLPTFEFIMSTRSDGDGRRGATVLAAALAILAAVMFWSPSASGAPEAPKVGAGIRSGQLNVVGTPRSDRITLRLKPGNKSRLQVDVGGNGSAEFTFRRSAFNRIVVHGAAGADTLSIEESHGAFTGSEATSLLGDAGSDLVAFEGSDAAERFQFSASRNRLGFAGAGTMTIAGAERFDLRTLGGADNVVVRDLTGAGLGRLDVDLGNDRAADAVDIDGSAAANDLRVSAGVSIRGIGATVNVLHARAANDRLNLDPGAGSDRVVVEGTAGNDTIGVAAAAVAPHIAVSGGPGGLAIDVVNSEALALESLAGNDTLNAGLGLAALTQLTLDGGAGNDALNGGDGNDILRGGSENDAIDGNGGADTALMGAGDDSFTWDPGDGSDKVEGEAGSDTLFFNGAAVAESFDLSANGNRLRLFRTQGTITMDVHDTERVDLRALGGIDNTVVNDLSGTDVKNVMLDLATDGAADTTTINGTGGNDTITITPNAGAVDVAGLAAAVKIERSEAASDVLNVNGLDGNDTISGAAGLAALIKVVIDGGDGDDTINGGDGAENLIGGDGDDTIDGNGGADTALMGAGSDTFVWDPGEGSDVVEGGQDGADAMLFNGANVAENFDVSGNGERVRFFRDVGNITMDLNDIEFIDVRALGGNDNAVLNDTAATGLKIVSLDLAGAIGGGAGDGAADSVTVNGTDVADDIQVIATGERVDVLGAPVTVHIDHAEAANDKLTVDGLGGDDEVAVGAEVAALIQTLVDLGADE
jgi:Ca2+-binding RTX toxin-like protein